jgi:hypothetical protein
MNKTDTIKELAIALSKAQSEMPPAQMNATNPFLKNKYADLGSIIKTAKPVLAKHGLSYSQLPVSDNGKIGVTTILMHSSGEWIASTMAMDLGEEKGKSAAQVAGSVITYLRRYSLASVLGMYADEDTDGNAPPTKSKPVNGKMSLETAKTVTNRDGEFYHELETEKLSHMANSLMKSLDAGGLSQEDREEREYKLDAIEVLLANR